MKHVVIRNLIFAALLFGCAETSSPVSPEEEPVIDNGSFTIVKGKGGQAALQPGEELPATLQRTFNCRPDQVGQELLMATLEGSSKDRVVIRPSGGQACHYDLIYLSENGDEHVISGKDASGYLFTRVLKTSTGVTVVCVNNIRHHPLEGEIHEIDTVTIDCARRKQGSWTALRPMVTPDGEWAAWLRTFQEDASQSHPFRLTFTHDFSFQFMNLTDAGRPTEDGLYEVGFSVTDDGFDAEEPSLVSEFLNPVAGGKFVKWNPTEQEKIDYAEFMTMDDGPCPNGCPVEEEP
jgi:hypothetical protein